MKGGPREVSFKIIPLVLSIRPKTPVGFSKISSSEHNIIFRNFLTRGQSRKVYTNFQTFFNENFRSIFFSSRNFWLSGSYFGNSTIIGIFGNFPRKFTDHLAPFQKYRNFWLYGKRPVKTLLTHRDANFVQN